MRRTIGFLSKGKPVGETGYSHLEKTFIKVGDGSRGMAGVLKKYTMRGDIHNFEFGEIIYYNPDGTPTRGKNSSIEIRDGSLIITSPPYSIEEQVKREEEVERNKTNSKPHSK